jgi:hypothetical protein
MHNTFRISGIIAKLSLIGSRTVLGGEVGMKILLSWNAD